MKPLLSTILAALLAVTLRAQAPETQYSADQLDQLLAPIALYPDPLLAVLLPASTFPSDISSAAQFLADNGTPSGIAAQPWDASVKALAHYPAVLKWMNDNADWTHALGAAFAVQPSDVMKSIQQLRVRARAVGTLRDTAQQRVDVEGDDLRIIPTQDSELYVPEYDPNSVYNEEDGDPGTYVVFGPAYAVGPWLEFECDWDDFGIWVGPWHSGWAYRREWRNPKWGGARWHPDAQRGSDLARAYLRPAAQLPSPRPAPGAKVAVRPSPAEAQRKAPVVQQPERTDYRGWGAGAVPKPAEPAPSSSLFGGYGRGTQTRDYSSRGHESQSAPISRPFESSGGSSGGRSSEAPSGGGHERH